MAACLKGKYLSRGGYGDPKETTTAPSFSGAPVTQFVSSQLPTKLCRATDCENIFFLFCNLLIALNQEIVRATDEHCFSCFVCATVEVGCVTWDDTEMGLRA
jgi:hypothetical protein